VLPFQADIFIYGPVRLRNVGKDALQVAQAQRRVFEHREHTEFAEMAWFSSSLRFFSASSRYAEPSRGKSNILTRFMIGNTALVVHILTRGIAVEL